MITGDYKMRFNMHLNCAPSTLTSISRTSASMQRTSSFMGHLCQKGRKAFQHVKINAIFGLRRAVDLNGMR